MVLELKTFRWRCDGCGAEEIQHGSHAKRPEGWEQRLVGGCGMTNYTREDDLCPDCLKKEPGS